MDAELASISKPFSQLLQEHVSDILNVVKFTANQIDSVELVGEYSRYFDIESFLRE